MSIAIVGQAKYDLQDLACVELMLRFYAFTEVEFFVEPVGGEDAELRFTAEGTPITAEIQVKGSEADVTLATVAECLIHFVAHKSDENLLDRLENDPGRMVVLVMSGRCDDSTRGLLAPKEWSGRPGTNDNLKWHTAASLLAELESKGSPDAQDSGLTLRRRDHCSTQAQRVRSQGKIKITKLFSRIFIIEQVNYDDLQERCRQHLQQKFRVPDHKCLGLIDNVVQLVKSAKGKGLETIGRLRLLLKEVTPQSARPQEYVERGEESDLKSLLLAKNVLLLTGPPRVGKSFTARWLAAELESEGYDVREFNDDIENANRFLLEAGENLRIGILDDPLGGLHANIAPTRARTQLEATAARTNARRKLVVAQAQDRLLETYRKSRIVDIRTAGHDWRDLSIGSERFLSALWEQNAKSLRVPDPHRKAIGRFLADGKLRLEAGCLTHLAVRHQQVRSITAVEDISRIAREDADTLGRALADEGFEGLLIAIAIGSSKSEPLSVADLGFLVGRGGNYLPSATSEDDSDDYFEEVQLDLNYESEPNLEPEEVSLLEKLERRRMIIRSQVDHLEFTHDYYRASSESLSNQPSSPVARRVIAIVKRGLFSASPRTSRAVARNLEWIFKGLETLDWAQDELQRLAMCGLRSCFLSTRDHCFRHLVRATTASSDDTISRWAQSVTDISIYDVEWRDGEALISPRRGWNAYELLKRMLEREKPPEVSQELAILRSFNTQYLAPQQADSVLRFFKVHPDSLDRIAIMRLLDCNEGLLRSAAVEIWLGQKEGELEDEEILARIFTDDHPSVGLGALKGCISGWASWPTDRQERCLAGLKEMASSPATAVTMLPLLSVYDREEYAGTSPPWRVFEILFPKVIEALPARLTFNDARFFNIAQTAIRELSAVAMVEICDQWINWIERTLAAGVILDDYMLGVADILVISTEDVPALRVSRVNRLLQLQGTGSLLVVIADLVDLWPHLIESEQLDVRRVLRASRKDSNWLKAVVLTRQAAPTCLAEDILGEHAMLLTDPPSLFRNMQPELLATAVQVYCGDPPFLWTYGKHHSAEGVWDLVVQMIAQTPSHELFELAWRELFRSNDGARLAQSVRACGHLHAGRLLDLLLRIKVSWSGHFMPDLWTALLELAIESDTTQQWISKMTRFAPVIIDDIHEMSYWLSGEAHKLILRELQNDLIIANLISIISNALKVIQSPMELWAPEESLIVLDGIRRTFERFPPKLVGTPDRVERFLISIPVKDERLMELIQTRKELIEEQNARIRADNEQQWRLPDDWIDISRTRLEGTSDTESLLLFSNDGVIDKFRDTPETLP